MRWKRCHFSGSDCWCSTLGSRSSVWALPRSWPNAYHHEFKARISLKENKILLLYSPLRILIFQYWLGVAQGLRRFGTFIGLILGPLWGGTTIDQPVLQMAVPLTLLLIMAVNNHCIFLSLHLFIYWPALTSNYESKRKTTELKSINFNYIYW